MRATKRLARAATGAGAEWDRAVYGLPEQEMRTVFSSADALDGATAFAEKQQPVWSGY